MNPKKEIRLDVSELEPPQPLVLAVQAMQKLEEDESLLFIHRMYPCKLEEQIQKFGLCFEIIKDEENYFEMRIQRC